MGEKKDENGDAGSVDDRILRLYSRLLGDRTQLRRVLLAEARCDQGCLLVHIFNTPQGTAWGRPARTIRTEPTLDPANPSGPPLYQPRVTQVVAAGLMGHDRVPSACRHIDYVPIGTEGLALGAPGDPVVNIFRRR